MLAMPLWMPRALTAALAAAMLASLAWQGREVMQQMQHTDPLPVLPESGLPASQRLPDIRIGELELFGIQGQATTQSVVETTALPVTNLRLVLRGVAEASERTPGSALVEGPDRETQTYRIGDTLPGNAKLHAVHDTRIVINRGGVLENLTFPEDTDSTGVIIEGARNGGHSSLQEQIVEEAASGSDGSEPVYAVPASYAPPAANPDETLANSESLNETQKAEIKARLEELRSRLRSNYQ